ncbi:hypothetical protein LOK49_LG04G02733 [Camellia lanceoleosa]|uniref:Uncharacterized protein n=1 Tax=Camellia lanceoleosa TaxID=1840588 RepID=A0ACC0HZ58_9ERIC|nr:hypothetical protein LOK49_LG04G02733 [Camellia lanceoleosa]
MANPCCTIEMEPRTLNGGQITLAREVAVDIVQKKEPDVASNIFMGLKPVSGINEEVVVQNVETGDSLDRVVESEEKKTDIVIGTSCQCSCTTSIMESPDDLQLKLKEPLSAPF